MVKINTVLINFIPVSLVIFYVWGSLISTGPMEFFKICILFYGGMVLWAVSFG